MDGGGVQALFFEILDEPVRPRLVRTKKSVFSCERAMAAATFTLSIWCTWMNRCSMSVTVCVDDDTSWKTGSVR